MANPLDAMTQAMTPKRAISYIRVSTREQAARGGTLEGFSIPAQRDANKKKAATIGALIVKEFVDRGESARSAKRPELQKMLAYIQERGDIDFVIVHKLDRLARNRADDVDINRALEQAGVRLISTTENIDQTPGGILMHGIMASIAEFYSRNLANEVIKGMSQKAKNGGTVGKAPLGYLNKQGRDPQGRETRWVDTDPTRGPLITQAFELYATGEWTLSSLAERLMTQGLTTLPTPSRPARTLDRNRLLDLLRNPYYRGVVVYQGVEYQGQHQALIDDNTWHTVQSVLSQHRSGERQRVHNHPLKTTIRCGECGGRLIVHMAKARSGDIYPYFVCSYRQRNRSGCSFKAVLIEEVEERIASLYRSIQFTHEERESIETYLRAELDRIYQQQQSHTKNLEAQRTKLQDERDKLLQAHYADAIPLELLKQEQERISKQLALIEREIATLSADKEKVENHLSEALNLLEDCYRLYVSAPDALKKLLNNVFFDHIAVNPHDDEAPEPVRTIAATPRPPFNRLLSNPLKEAAHAETPSGLVKGVQLNIRSDDVSCKSTVVPPVGLEPTTRRF